MVGCAYETWYALLINVSYARLHPPYPRFFSTRMVWPSSRTTSTGQSATPARWWRQTSSTAATSPPYWTTCTSPWVLSCPMPWNSQQVTRTSTTVIYPQHNFSVKSPIRSDDTVILFFIQPWTRAVNTCVPSCACCQEWGPGTTAATVSLAGSWILTNAPVLKVGSLSDHYFHRLKIPTLSKMQMSTH